VPGDDVAVVAFGELADGVEVEGEGGEADRHGGGLGGGGGHGGTVVLVVEPCGRRGGVGKPVQRGVGQDVVGAERGAEELPAPGQLTGRRIGQGVREGLRLGLLSPVVDGVLGEGLPELQRRDVLAGEVVELAVVAAGKGEELRHVHPDDVLAVQLAEQR
jgi:hypothetical protein